MTGTTMRAAPLPCGCAPDVSRTAPVRPPRRSEGRRRPAGRVGARYRTEVAALGATNGSEHAQARGTEAHGRTSATQGEPASAVRWLNQNFQDARQHFQQKKYDRAANEIAEGAAFVRGVDAATAVESDADLSARADDLDALADGVRVGKVDSVARLNHVFGQTDHALATYYHDLAKSDWASNQAKATGNALDTSASYLEQAANWTGDKVSDAVDATRTVAGKLVKGAGWATDEVAGAISSLGSGIQAMGDKLERQG